MTVVGVTGHSNLTPDALDPVRRALRDHLRPLRTGLVGVSCIARGADQVFADVVLELGGALEVVLPAADGVSGAAPGARRAAATVDAAAPPAPRAARSSGRARR